MNEDAKFALVTGATGFTGGHLARTLRDEGYRVRALVRRAHSAPAQALASDGIEIVEGDVAHAEAVDQAVAGTSQVFHLATSR